MKFKETSMFEPEFAGFYRKTPLPFLQFVFIKQESNFFSLNVLSLAR